MEQSNVSVPEVVYVAGATDNNGGGALHRQRDCCVLTRSKGSIKEVDDWQEKYPPAWRDECGRCW